MAYYDTDGRRRFYTFADYEAAKSKAKDVAATISRGEAKTLTLSGAHCVHYLRAMDALRPVSVPLDIAATEYADAKQRLGEHTLKDAVTFYLKVQVGTVEKPVAEIVAEFIETKSVRTSSGRPASVDYLRDIRNRLGKFSETFHCNLSSVGSAEIGAFLDGLKVAGRTWFNYARLLQTLFRFAQKKHYYPRNVDPFEDLDIDYDDDGRIEIFKTSEIARLLSAARDEIVPFVAIGAFAGLRHAEIARLDWSDIKADHIEVTKGKAKTRSRRIVPIQPNLQQWLAPYRQQTGKAVPYSSMSKQLGWLAEATAVPPNRKDGSPAQPAVKWCRNGLRHSFISYRMAILKNENAVALEAGNSPQMIFQHYRELVTPSEAKAWFSITPEPTEIVTSQIDRR